MLSMRIRLRTRKPAQTPIPYNMKKTQIRFNRYLAVVFVASLALVQGCMAMGVSRVEVLSQQETIVSPRQDPLPLLVVIRIGLVEGEINSINQGYLVGNLVAKLSEGNLFRQVIYPAFGVENMVLEIGGTMVYHPPSNAVMMIGNIFLCSLTLTIVCPHISSDYDYTLSARTVRRTTNEEISRYLVVGKSRVASRWASRDDTDQEGWRAAATSAYDQLIALMRADEEKFLSGADL